MDFSALLEGVGELFTPLLQWLQTLYPRALSWSYRSTIGSLGLDYNLEWLPGTHKVETHIDLFPVGGDPSPILAHKRRETNFGSEAGVHVDLSPIINPLPLGRAQEFR